MKRTILFVGFIFALGFAKANTKVEHSLSVNKSPKNHVIRNWHAITITNSVKYQCSDGSYIITGYVYTTVDSDTGAILGVTYTNTGATCGSDDSLS
jgi:hypothetical protein